MGREHLIKPLLGKAYPMIEYGRGIYLYDKTGKEYIDGCSGAVTASIGHGNQEVLRAMHQQAQNVSFVYRAQFTNQPAEQLAKKLSTHTPGDLNWSFFINSGTEATETAIKIAIQHWQERGITSKYKIASRWMSYHGITMGALSVSGFLARRKRFLPLLNDSPSISPPYCYRCPFERTYPSCQLLCAKELETVIERTGSEHIAAFIAEPIVGAAGAALVPPDGYYQEIKRICERYDILFIADEVMTGIGRTGKMFACEHWGVIPDLIVLGKGISAGYAPIAATVVSDQVIEPILHGSKSIMSGHTYSANPQSTAVALAVLEFVEKHDLVKKAAEQGEYLLQQLQKLKRSSRMIGDIRGKGMLIGIEFVSNHVSKQPFHQDMNVTERVIEKAMEHGLLVYPAASGRQGNDGNAILIAPPLVITKTEIDEMISRLSKALTDVQRYLVEQGLWNNCTG